MENIVNGTGKDGHNCAETVPLRALIFRRPKVALRRITDPILRRLVKSYDLNRRNQANDVARKAVERHLEGQ